MLGASHSILIGRPGSSGVDVVGEVPVQIWGLHITSLVRKRVFRAPQALVGKSCQIQSALLRNGEIPQAHRKLIMGMQVPGVESQTYSCCVGAARPSACHIPG